MAFGRRIAVMRTARDIKQKDLAVAVGMVRPYLSGIETGALAATDDTRIKLRAALAPWGDAEDKALDVLLGGDGSGN